MFICHKAQSTGLGRTALNVLPKHDNVCTLKEISHASRFSTTANPRMSGIEPARNGKKSSAKERQRAERTQLTRLLKESPVKRDARNFLKHFDTPKKSQPAAAPSPERASSDVVERAHHNEWRLTRTGVNLGNLYEPYKAIQNSPVFAQQPLPDKPLPEKDNVEPLHLALVKLREPQALDDRTLGGIALTLSQMARLGLNIAVVVDCDESGAPDTQELSPAWDTTVREQASRIVEALEEYNEPGAFEVDHALYYSRVDAEIPSTVQVRGDVEVKNNQLLFPPIEDGIIPVIPPFAYDSELKKVRVRADEVVFALTREFAGISAQNVEENDSQLEDAPYDQTKALFEKPLLDRIIIIDPLGGIPSENRADGAHVFINLEAEFQEVKKELEQRPTSASGGDEYTHHSILGGGNPISKFVESEIATLPGPQSQPQLSSGNAPYRHVKNLEVVEKALQLLPSSSSALIITPTEAAISSRAPLLTTPSTGVRTRRSKNPLIHNLLTDKPMISSSLPAPLVPRPVASTAPNPATFLKKGIPVTMIPDPRTTGPWQPPSPSNPSIELETDPRINFPRLVDLIEDSFRRKLDAKHYLDRIRGRVAGIIIAGDYEGGAICTWETPSSLHGERPAPDSHLWIPYLDKFAVLTASQGSGGVADIVWGALTRSCFPKGVVWRSRTSNPVNKWYFERAIGMWNLPDGYWTMFWTTEGVMEEWAQTQQVKEKDSSFSAGQSKAESGEMTKWDAYVRVCGSVSPSWADGKKPD